MSVFKIVRTFHGIISVSSNSASMKPYGFLLQKYWFKFDQSIIDLLSAFFFFSRPQIGQNGSQMSGIFKGPWTRMKRLLLQPNYSSYFYFFLVYLELTRTRVHQKSKYFNREILKANVTRQRNESFTFNPSHFQLLKIRYGTRTTFKVQGQQWLFWNFPILLNILDLIEVMTFNEI